MSIIHPISRAETYHAARVVIGGEMVVSMTVFIDIAPPKINVWIGCPIFTLKQEPDPLIAQEYQQAVAK